MKLFCIILIFLCTACKAYSQESHASISATIVTPVGAELSGEVNKESIGNSSSGMSSHGVNAKELKKQEHLTFLKIIGEVFSHHTTIENEHLVLKRKDNEEVLSANKYQPVVRITVNFD